MISDLETLAVEMASLRVIAAALIDRHPQFTEMTADLLARLDEMNIALIDEPGRLRGEMPWWTEWKSAKG
jgi:hypothetical protein